MAVVTYKFGHASTQNNNNNNASNMMNFRRRSSRCNGAETSLNNGAPASTSFLDDEDIMFAEVSDDFSLPAMEDVSTTAPKKVSFNTEAQIIPSAAPLDLIALPQQFGDLWYDLLELDAFRTEARDLCRALRTQCPPHAASSNPTEQPPRLCGLARDGATRGLEQRSCLERQRRKYLTGKCILQGQHKLNADRLAALSRRCSGWAAEVAAEEAKRDFARAYLNLDMDDNEVVPIVPDHQTMVMDDVAAVKRSWETSTAVLPAPAQQPRRVRPRLFFSKAK